MRVLLLLAALAASGCGGRARPPVLTFSASALGREADVVRRQLARFEAAHPGLAVRLRATPDAADDRHQLYVQWLNAHVADPDVLQLDVIWTPEFAAAGWILPLDRFHPPVDRFFSAAIAADTWRGSVYALPWFVDVGMLYWRRDLMAEAPRSLDALMADAARAQAHGAPFGLVWTGARYEGLVTVFLEYLGGFGGRLMDDRGRVTVDSPAGVRALRAMRDAVVRQIVPRAALTWQEEQVRFAFQNGQAAFMLNWPYAYPLIEHGTDSRVAGRVGIAAMPAAAGGTPTAALGGSQLAINAYSDQPDQAYLLLEYLLQPAQMLERARVAGQFPARRALYDEPALGDALGLDPGAVRQIVDRAVPRPPTPIYSQLSEILQVQLHRALTGQADPDDALREAAAGMRQALARAGLEAPPRP